MICPRCKKVELIEIIRDETFYICPGRCRGWTFHPNMKSKCCKAGIGVYTSCPDGRNDISVTHVCSKCNKEKFIA